ncbi:MAG: histidine ammonia-lyase [Actinomycetota bacterium]|jgi:histidine ammonia-lyase|nr:histidine ammonia-lyase [Actinomycetota bacterium]
MPVLIGEPLTFEDVLSVATRAEPVELARSARTRIARARQVVEETVKAEATVYGVTTGFGGLANVRIAPGEATRLQEDIVRSHAAAVGPPLTTETVRAMMVLKARTLAFGISGIRPMVLETMLALINEGVHPIVPSQGSLGASGDLAQLAHLALPLLGEGRVEYRGRVMDSAEALRAAGIQPLELSYKEGLALVNGTEGMLAIGILTLLGAQRLARCADITGAMILEACLGTDQVFDQRLIDLRKHQGSKLVAANLRRLLAGSEIVGSHRHSDHLVQDAYSLRCIPQVHGAYRDGLAYVEGILLAELGSAVDNPSVLLDAGEMRSSGNFHGESLAIGLDHLALCVAGYGTIAERRIARLVDPNLNNGLPAFLTDDPGRRSGYMLVHYTAASLVAEDRSLTFPVSSDSISTSAGQEDHVSMGFTAARKAAAILANTRNVIAIEGLAAAQGLDMRGPLQPAPATAAAVGVLREVSPYLVEDRPLADDIGAAAKLISGGALSTAVEEVTGSLD